jgi:hypothetical protein
LVNEIVSSKPFIDGRGKNFCRGCLGENLFSALDLGDLPIANELLLTSESKIERFPLHLRVCTHCGLGQVADVVTPERIFRDYRYLSSLSTTFLKHALDFVNQQVETKSFSQEDWVLEIASNDGYLLKNFIPLGIKVVGVEPAENVAAVSRSLGIETISEFFSSQLASELLSQRGYPRMIIANNVMAHVPDLIDFICGLKILCGPTTEISIENPSIANILIGMQFDTIYHEHYSYLSASTVSQLSKLNGLQLFRVEELSIHGGSNRYWLRTFSEITPVDPSVDLIIEFEKENGLFESTEWMNYSVRVSKVLKDFHTWLKNGAKQGMRIYGYGAAAKASTLLNSINIEAGLILAIADASFEKQNRFMPPNGIKIVSPEQLLEQKPTDILIFPWNIKTEIALNLNQTLGAQVRLWCAIPEMHQVQFS